MVKIYFQTEVKAKQLGYQIGKCAFASCVFHLSWIMLCVMVMRKVRLITHIQNNYYFWSFFLNNVWLSSNILMVDSVTS